MKKKTKSRIYQTIAYIFGIAILFALIYYIGFTRFSTIILQVSPYWMVLSVIIYGISWVFRTWRLKQLTTHARKNIKIFELFKLHISGQALNTILPIKLGDAALVGYLKMKDISIGRSVAIIFQTRMLDILALVSLCVPVLTLTLEKSRRAWIGTTIVICIFVIALPFSMVVLDKNKTFSNFLEKLANKFNYVFLNLIIHKIKDMYESYHGIIADRKLLLSTTLLSLIIWLFEGLTCYIISIATHTQISILASIVAVSIGNIGKSIPATPGGIGIYESSLAATLVLFGVSFDIAFVIAVLDHVIKKIFTLIFGIPSIFRM